MIAPKRAGLIALLTACAPSGDDPLPPSVDTWGVEAAPLLRIGEVDGSAEYVFSRIAGIRLLDDGAVAVADGASNEIRVFDRDGSLRTRMGGPGDGPGEFRWMGKLSYWPPDTLAVFDAEAGRLTRFLTGGTLAGAPVTFRADDGRVEVHLGRFTDGSHALAWIRQEGDRDRSRLTPDPMAIARFSADGSFVRLLTDDVGMRRLGPAPVPFSPHFTGRVLGDVLYHGDGATPDLARTPRIGPPGPPLELDMDAPAAADAWSAVRAGADTATLAALSDLEGAPGLDSVPYFSDLLEDSEGLLWIKVYDPGTDTHWGGRRRTGGFWSVVDPDGTPVARVRVPEGFRLMDVRGGAVAGLARDELGVEYVEVRALER